MKEKEEEEAKDGVGEVRGEAETERDTERGMGQNRASKGETGCLKCMM